MFGLCLTTRVSFWAVKGLRPSGTGVYLLLYIILGAAGLVWALAELRLRLTDDSTDSDLEIVRVDVQAGSDDDRFPVLDITVRNRGAVSAVIHELRVWDVEIWRFGLTGRGMPGLVASWRYNVDLDGEGPQTFRLSHVVDPRASDRFEVRVGTTNHEALPGVFLYKFRAALIVDRRRQQLSLGEFLVKIPLPRRILGFHTTSPTRQDVLEQVARAQMIADRVANRVIVQTEARDVLAEVLAEGDKL